ncbi:MAG: hypothetical protein IJ417_01125 [Bacteroidaceae bacterium]|nr:hypothetical protein [Bacteroidaceae bacterium]
MKKCAKKQTKCGLSEPKRAQHLVCLVSEDEMRIVNQYLQKYRITNKSRWMRETLLSFIHRNIVDEDYPTLFNENEMRR